MPMETEQFNVQEQVRRYFRLLGERWYTVAVTAVIFCLIGFGLAQLWPVTYEASTSFLIRESQLIDDTTLEKSLKRLRPGVKQQTLMSEIRSFSRLSAVLEELEWHEYMTARLNRQAEIDFYDKIRDALSVRINTDTVGGDTLVEFLFEWTDPVKAASFCNAMRDHWIDLKIRIHQADARDKLEKAEVVLRERNEAYTRAKQVLEQFDQETRFAALGTLEYNEKLRAEMVPEIDRNRGIVLSLKKQIAQLESELATMPETVELPEQTMNPDYTKALQDWKAKAERLKDKESSYTRNHPKLKQLMEEEAAARKLLESLEDKKFVALGLKNEVNQEYVNKSSLLDQLRRDYAKAAAYLEIGEKRLREVEEKLDVLPRLQAERNEILAAVDHEREVYEKAHEEILPLRDQVKSFRTVTQRGGIRESQETFKHQTFDILQVAAVPTEPKNPMMVIILSVSLVIGLGLGLCFALLGEIVKASFSTQEEVVHHLRKPVLGMVNKIMTESEIKALKWRKVIFTSSTLLVIFSLVAIIYICNQYPQLIPPSIIEKVNQIREALS